jgi:hypothetical protein
MQRLTRRAPKASHRQRSNWRVPFVALVIVVLTADSLSGSSAAAPPRPLVAFAGYGLGNFTAPFHVAKTEIGAANGSGGCANSSNPGLPYFNPATGRSVSTDYARVESCAGQDDSYINSGFGAAPYLLVNSSVGRISVLLKMTVRFESTWNFTSGNCTAAANGSAGSCRTSADAFGYAEAGLAISPTDAGVSYGVEKQLTIVYTYVNATCSGGTCVGWSTAPQSGTALITEYYTFSFSYTMSSSHRYLIWAVAGANNYPETYGIGASLTGAYVQETTKVIWSVNSILIT